jgi:hypothetical protein
MDFKYFLKFSFKVKMIFRCSGIPVFRHSGVPAFRCSGIPVFRHSFFYYMPNEIEAPKKNLPRPPPSSRRPWLALQGFYMLAMLVQFNAAYCVVKSFTSRQFCIGTVWFRVQFGKNMHE